jgi:hypothetical protein
MNFRDPQDENKCHYPRAVDSFVASSRPCREFFYGLGYRKQYPTISMRIISSGSCQRAHMP